MRAPVVASSKRPISLQRRVVVPETALLTAENLPSCSVQGLPELFSSNQADDDPGEAIHRPRWRRLILLVRWHGFAAAGWPKR